MEGDDVRTPVRPTGRPTDRTAAGGRLPTPSAVPRIPDRPHGSAVSRPAGRPAAVAAPRPADRSHAGAVPGPPGWPGTRAVPRPADRSHAGAVPRPLRPEPAAVSGAP